MHNNMNECPYICVNILYFMLTTDLHIRTHDMDTWYASTLNNNYNLTIAVNSVHSFEVRNFLFYF